MNPTATPSQPPFDESLLTAYLDGELDDQQRGEVDRAIAADPALLRTLDGLAATRDWLSSHAVLAPSAGLDLSTRVLARIEREQGVRAARHRWTVLATSLATVAALALVAVAPRWFAPRPAVTLPRGGQPELAQRDQPPGDDGREREQLAEGLSPSVSRPTPVGDAAGLPADPALSITDSSVGVAGSVAHDLAKPPTLRRAGSGDVLTGQPGPIDQSNLAARQLRLAELAKAAQDRESDNQAGLSIAVADPRERLRELLGRPGLVRIVVAADRIEDKDLQAIDKLLAQESLEEPDFLRISLSQQIVIDPAHPQDAVVFAVVMNHEHVGSFRRGLEKELGTASGSFRVNREENPRPNVTALLGEVGEIKLLTQPSNVGQLARISPRPPTDGVASLAMKSALSRSGSLGVGFSPTTVPAGETAKDLANLESSSTPRGSTVGKPSARQRNDQERGGRQPRRTLPKDRPKHHRAHRPSALLRQ